MKKLSLSCIIIKTLQSLNIFAHIHNLFPNISDSMTRHRVAFVSDFFFPGFGGVEVHIYNVAQCLMRRGHKVIVITRAYGERVGVRYLTNGLKVYYLPILAAKLPPGSVTLPTWLTAFPLVRAIFIR